MSAGLNVLLTQARGSSGKGLQQHFHCVAGQKGIAKVLKKRKTDVPYPERLVKNQQALYYWKSLKK